MTNNEQLVLHLAERRDRGAHAHIFHVVATNRAYKLFLSVRPIRPGSSIAEQNEEARRKMFEDECIAYELASGSADLVRHVPQFFGAKVVSDVLNDSRSSVADEYVLDRCYCMQWVEGPVAKLYAKKGALPYLEALERKFQDAGIKYTRDASVINSYDEQNVVFIDFGTQEFELEHEELPFQY
jgi:hypothetical protein